MEEVLDVVLYRNTFIHFVAAAVIQDQGAADEAQN